MISSGMEDKKIFIYPCTMCQFKFWPRISLKFCFFYRIFSPLCVYYYMPIFDVGGSRIRFDPKEPTYVALCARD